jgi:hypothetical protein
VGSRAREEWGLRASRGFDWPDGKKFAFTVFDDTDLATLDNVGPVYELLTDLGMRTTKSVWPLEGDGVAPYRGVTTEDARYRDWTLGLQSKGFEIGYHGASYSTSDRQRVIAALESFRSIYGSYPTTMANHSRSRESIYWGSSRVSGIHRVAYGVMTRFRRNGMFRGHIDGDPLFWGDLCRSRIRYVRNFTFADIDTLAACPMMPYHDAARPYVAKWFASSEGSTVGTFNRCIAEGPQDRLEASGSACIMYAHFAAGFSRDGQLDPRFVELMTRLSRKDGWFVPVATLLDFLAEQRGEVPISGHERRALERRWLWSKVRLGST